MSHLLIRHGVWLDPEKRICYTPQHEINNLTPNEWWVLQLLMDRPGRIVTFSFMQTRYTKGSLTADAIRTIIRRLRRKLFVSPEAGKLFIKTCRGEGYVIPLHIEADV